MIRLDGVVAGAGGFRLGPLDLQVARGEYFVLLGPSGAGKTLLLEIIAGLRRPVGGRVLLADEDADGVPPEHRGVGFVYQDSLLFPNLDVAGNIAFGLGPGSVSEWARRGLRRPPVADDRIAAAAGLVGAERLLDRPCDGLSGGEQQRVALARALVSEPRLLLLDEPLANLDQTTRESLQSMLRRIHQRFPTTVLHVTHDLQEATVLADRCAVLGEGRLRQTGLPEEVFRRPADTFVARFTGGRNLLTGRARRVGALTDVALDGGGTLLSATSADGPVAISVRPEDIELSRRDSSDDRAGPPAPATAAGPDGVSLNRVAGTVAEVVDQGATALVRVAGSPALTALLTRRQLTASRAGLGDPVWAGFPPESVHLFAPDAPPPGAVAGGRQNGDQSPPPAGKTARALSRPGIAPRCCFP